MVAISQDGNMVYHGKYKNVDNKSFFLGLILSGLLYSKVKHSQYNDTI